MLLVHLVDGAATMMADAVGSYGCTHINDDDLKTWLKAARRYFPRADGIESIADKILREHGER